MCPEYVICARCDQVSLLINNRYCSSVCEELDKRSWWNWFLQWFTREAVTRSYLIGVLMVAATAAIVMAGKGRAEVVLSEVRGLICKSEAGVKSVFDVGASDPKLSMQQSVEVVNGKMKDECTFAAVFYAKKERVSEVVHAGRTFDVYRILIFADERSMLGEGFAAFNRVGSST